MPALESVERVDQALAALREYQAANRRVAIAQSAANEKLGVLKSLTGIAGNDPQKIEEELLSMIGRAHVAGIMEQR